MDKTSFSAVSEDEFKISNFIMICKHSNICWLLICLLASWVWEVSAGGNRAILTVIDFAPWSYTCIISDYGNSLDLGFIYAGNIMRPPGDPQLCAFPEEISDVLDNMTESLTLSQSPIALLVSLGGCDVHTKARIALEINAEVANSIGYVIFYNNDADQFDEIVQITPPTSGSNITLPENLKSIAFLSVSTGAGASMMGRIQRYSRVTAKNPEFLSFGNARWNLPMLLERIPEQSSLGLCTNCNATLAEANFYWFRLVLFALLIISPCCRAGYLWWAGGGRIQFRRNENGRITGIQYIPPISYWFASNGVQEARAPVTDRLTEEQVFALPEIVYKALENDSDNEDNRNEDCSTTLEDVDIVVNAGTEDGRPLPEKETVIKTADEEQPPIFSNYTTTCTTCSICIEEFENGERIRVLPRCRHGFHYECIKPWLTERQGCCPLCKTSVIEQVDVEDDSNEDIVDGEPTNSHVETATELESENDISVSRGDTAVASLSDTSPESDLSSIQAINSGGLREEENTGTNDEGLQELTTLAGTEVSKDNVPSNDRQGEDAERHDESTLELLRPSPAIGQFGDVVLANARADSEVSQSGAAEAIWEGKTEAGNSGIPSPVPEVPVSEASLIDEESDTVSTSKDSEEDTIEIPNALDGEPK